jgi:hypothetical protein
MFSYESDSTCSDCSCGREGYRMAPVQMRMSRAQFKAVDCVSDAITNSYLSKWQAKPATKRALCSATNLTRLARTAPTYTCVNHQQTTHPPPTSLTTHPPPSPRRAPINTKRDIIRDHLQHRRSLSVPSPPQRPIHLPSTNCVSKAREKAEATFSSESDSDSYY